MDAGLADHTDVCDVTPMDAQVGAPDGDGDSTQKWTEARDDLDERDEWLETGWGRRVSGGW